MTTYTGVTTSSDWICAECGRRKQEHPCEGFMRKHRAFVAMLRIKNEERWIAEVITSIQSLCEKIYILDDHSTDSTAQICRSFEKVQVFESPFEGLDEARDKNWLLDQILADCCPEWILCIDGDEVLEERGPEIIRDTVLGVGKYRNSGDRRMAFSLQVAFMWDSPTHVRVDRIYGDFWRPSLFKPFEERPHIADDRKLAQEFRFMSTPFGRHIGNDKPNLHCSSVPQRLLHGRGLCPARLKHYGYMDRKDRVRKLDYYTSIDWLNRAEDCYRHMTQGDWPKIEEMPNVQALQARGILSAADVNFICDTPPTAILGHAGPIQVVPWNGVDAWPISEWARAQHGS